MDRQLLTISFPYHSEPKRLAKTLEKYQDLTQGTRDKICIVIIDSGPKDDKSLPGILQISNPNWPDIRAFKINNYRKWNISSAKNIGFYEAPSDLVLSLDSDHWIEEASITKLLGQNIEAGKIYKFKRIKLLQTSRVEAKPASNCYLTTKATFYEIGGYDEKFSGHYGREDDEFFRRAAKKGIKIVQTDNYIHTAEAKDEDNRERSLLINKWKNRLRLPLSRRYDSYSPVSQ